MDSGVGSSSSGPAGARSTDKALKEVVKSTFVQANNSGSQYAEVGETIVTSFDEYRRGQDRLLDDLAYQRAKTGGKNGSFAQRNPVLVRTGAVAAIVVALEAAGLVLDTEQMGAVEQLVDALMVLGPAVVALVGAPLAQQKTTPVGANPRGSS